MTTLRYGRADGRRRILGLALAAVAAVAGGIAAIRPEEAPEASPEPAAEGQVWMCTFRDCEPYYYVPARGDVDNVNGAHPIPPGTRFEDLPEDWICPICGSDRGYFIKVRGEDDPEPV